MLIPVLSSFPLLCAPLVVNHALAISSTLFSCRSSPLLPFLHLTSPQVIKSSRSPIICICNDRQAQKIRHVLYIRACADECSDRGPSSPEHLHLLITLHFLSSPIPLSISLSVYLSVCLPVCLPVCQSVSTPLLIFFTIRLRHLDSVYACRIASHLIASLEFDESHTFL